VGVALAAAFVALGGHLWHNARSGPAGALGTISSAEGWVVRCLVAGGMLLPLLEMAKAGSMWLGLSVGSARAAAVGLLEFAASAAVAGSSFWAGGRNSCTPAPSAVDYAVSAVLCASG
jgi:hypothetical protein